MDCTVRPVLFFVIVCAILTAGPISWRGEYASARTEARKNHKNLLILLVRSPQNARKLLSRIHSDARLSREISHSFVSVLIVVDSRSRYPIELYYTIRFPALFLVDPTTEIPFSPPCVGNALIGCLQDALKQRF